MHRSSALVLSVALLAAGSAATAAPAAAADRAFVAKVSQGGMFEIEAGKLAVRKASAMDVRDFAAAEVHDHALVGDRLKAISASAGIAVAPALNADFSAKLGRLGKLSGPGFDAAYLREMAALHDADGAAFAKEATAGGSPAYRAFSAETHRIVQRHIGAIHALPVA